MKAIISEILVHLMFLMLCLFVAYAAMDPIAFTLADTVKRLCASGNIMKIYVNPKEQLKAEDVSLSTLYNLLFPDTLTYQKILLLNNTSYLLVKHLAILNS